MTRSNEPQRTHEDEAGSDALESLLSEYVAADARGQDAAALYPTVAALLAADPRLRAEAAQLRASVAPLYDGDAPPADTRPEPDLSFLRRPPPAAAAPPAGLRERIVRFTESLLEQSRPRQLVRGEQKGRGQRLYHYHTPAAPTEDFDLTVEIFAEDEENVTVSVMALDPARDPFSQGGTLLSLRWGEGAVEGESDATGYAVFSAIPASALPDLVVVARAV